MSIEVKIKTGKYASLGSAKRVITMRGGRDKKRLMKLATAWFSNEKPNGVHVKRVKADSVQFDAPPIVLNVEDDVQARMNAAGEAYPLCQKICKRFDIEMKELILDLMKLHGVMQAVASNPNAGIDGTSTLSAALKVKR